MATLISTFREHVRVLIGDNDPDIQLVENSQIDAAMRLVLDLGRVVGDQTSAARYACDTARTGVTPDLTSAADPKALAQLIYYAAKRFVSDAAPASWRTRAFSETRGEGIQKVFHLVEELYHLENGEMSGTTDYD